MKSAVHTIPARSEAALAWRVFGGFLLILLVVAGGLKALFAKLFTDYEHAPSSRSRSWLAEARSQASIATSYAVMAKTMLQSSRRDYRQERQSRS
ncbi:hypothetical protein SAMN06265338_11028 [Rhodoblastus acidophilus]|uniref:Uncharacterized protein n=1 Tax=Rhodoblastus acidophilus TaxID=1074 RepID=A0A212S0U0_RHOAC|nr:hypothetical protein [Rhodoblastus acidophilus]SNB78581.1 hypothetical protein SAMN06265338_11028 [Rhodoblastus acidophilus]